MTAGKRTKRGVLGLLAVMPDVLNRASIGGRTTRGLRGLPWSTGVGDWPLATGCRPLMLLVWVVWSVGVGGVGLADDRSLDKYFYEAEDALTEQAPRRAIEALKEYKKYADKKYAGVTAEREWEFLYIYGTLLANYGTTVKEVKEGHALLVKVGEKLMKKRRGTKEYRAALRQESKAEKRLKALEEEEARRAEALRPGRSFRDCDACPEVVVVPAGSYMMGSEKGDSDEKPVHRVTIAQQLAVGKYEVTFAEWEACVAGGGCGGYRPDDEGWGRGRRPVINVSWEDAQNYVRWLSEETGKPYRLLSEAEWEYVARAGTTTRYTWGDEIGRNRANCDGCGSRWDNKQTAPVGRFAANAFGLHDMHGNVWEWTQDCWHNNYRGAPSNGGAWESGECSGRVLRGGSWYDRPRNLRSANRYWNSVGIRYNDSGFRLARTLTP